MYTETLAYRETCDNCSEPHSAQSTSICCTTRPVYLVFVLRKVSFDQRHCKSGISTMSKNHRASGILSRAGIREITQSNKCLRCSMHPKSYPETLHVNRTAYPAACAHDAHLPNVPPELALRPSLLHRGSLYPGSQFTGIQKSGNATYDVTVEITVRCC